MHARNRIKDLRICPSNEFGCQEVVTDSLLGQHPVTFIPEDEWHKHVHALTADVTIGGSNMVRRGITCTRRVQKNTLNPEKRIQGLTSPFFNTQEKYLQGLLELNEYTQEG